MSVPNFFFFFTGETFTFFDVAVPMEETLPKRRNLSFSYFTSPLADRKTSSPIDLQSSSLPLSLCVTFAILTWAQSVISLTAKRRKGEGEKKTHNRASIVSFFFFSIQLNNSQQLFFYKKLCITPDNACQRTKS